MHIKSNRKVPQTNQLSLGVLDMDAPIEKEMLAIVFSTQIFRDYFLGKTIVVQTDQKPLKTLLRKPMAAALWRLQSMILKYLKLEYLSGKKQVLADTWSHASLHVDEAPLKEDEIEGSAFWKESQSQSKNMQNSSQKKVYQLHML